MEHKKEHIDSHEKALDLQKKPDKEEMPKFFFIRQEIEYYEDLRNTERHREEEKSADK